MTFITLEGQRRKADIVPMFSLEPDRRQEAAERGSQKLRDAILKMHGLKPPPRRLKPRTPELIKQAHVCPSCLAPVGPARRLIADIQQVVAAYYGLNPILMTSAERRREITGARQVAMYLASQLTQHSIAEIGRRFKRDHTTVLHALKVVNARAGNDDQFAFDVSVLRERLMG